MGEADNDERKGNEKDRPEDPEEEPRCKKPRGKLRGFEFFRSIGSPRYVCAPMVDQSELAFRMLTRRYGCELAYTPMLHSANFANDAKYRKQHFTTCEGDRPLFTQFCGDNPTTMAAAAKHCQNQCDAVDINLGCPQGIARKGHYGAYLLPEVDLVESIVRTMDAELAVPVTCKIRLLHAEPERLQETVNLARRLEAAGCSLLTLHGRTKEMKGQHTGPCNWEAVKIVKSQLGIPVFVNGGIETFQDVERCLAETGCDGVMSSEALLETPSLFSGRQVRQDVLTSEYLELAKIYDAPKSAVKAHLFRFLYAGLQYHIDIRAQLGSARNFEDINAAAEALRARRDNEIAARNGIEDPDRPDSGWYLRYRRPLGDRSEKQSRAERKAAVTAAQEAAQAAAPDAKE